MNHRHIQKQIVQYLVLKGLYPRVVDQSGDHIRGSGTPGNPDLFCLLRDGRALFIEVKGPGGRLSTAQLEFGEACKRRGTPYVVAWSLDDVIAKVKALEGSK